MYSAFHIFNLFCFIGEHLKSTSCYYASEPPGMDISEPVCARVSQHRLFASCSKPVSPSLTPPVGLGCFCTHIMKQFCEKVFRRLYISC